mmetsp:Transcript_70485/g.228249  ORF Transcript_70485/g.228249 Transcript_70485/m.228249 type:complete len:231 (+) Transcript_70485:1220-1912(+)
MRRREGLCGRHLASPLLGPGRRRSRRDRARGPRSRLGRCPRNLSDRCRSSCGRGCGCGRACQRVHACRWVAHRRGRPWGDPCSRRDRACPWGALCRSRPCRQTPLAPCHSRSRPSSCRSRSRPSRQSRSRACHRTGPCRRSRPYHRTLPCRQNRRSRNHLAGGHQSAAEACPCTPGGSRRGRRRRSRRPREAGLRISRPRNPCRSRPHTAGGNRRGRRPCPRPFSRLVGP